MVIGNWKTSALLGLIAASLWSFALGWYFVGNQRLRKWWQRTRLRLGSKPHEE